MKKYLLNGIAAITMGLATSSCGQEFDTEQQEQKASINNAQQTLGFYIPDNQDWVMTSMATATFTVKGLSDTNDTVYVFSNNPQAEGYGEVLASAPLTGETTTINEFRIPQYMTKVFVGLKESDGNMIYKYVDVEDGVINASYDFTITSNARTRSITVNGDTYNAFTFPSRDELAAAYPTSIPAGTEEVDNLEALYKGKTYQDQWGNTQTMWDLYAIYAGRIKEGYNLKVTRTGVVELGGSYQNSGWDNSAGMERARPYNVYVSVDGNLTIRRNGATHFNLYILKGNVTLESNYGEQAGSISVAAGATLNDQRKSIAANQGVKMYNRGTINATNTGGYDIGNFSTIYNEGKFYISGAMSYSPGDANTSYFINMGDDAEITAPSMTLNSSCNFYNSGKVNITNETFVTQSGIYWINNGYYKTGSIEFSAWNKTFYNYCQLIVTGLAYMHDGQFNLMSGSYAEIGTAKINNFEINMNGNAGINIIGDNEWGAQGDNVFQGFKGTGDNNYVRLGGTTTVAAHKYSLVTEGKIYIGIKYLNDLGKDNIWYGPDYEFRENTKVVQFSELKPTYSSTSCGASWTNNPPIQTTPIEKQIWTYAFEDNTTRCDFDMNDVVIQVKENDSDASKLDITLVAAGCEYDNYVYLGNTRITWPEGAEVHAALQASTRTMVNTGRGVDKSAVTVTISKPSANFDFQNADFKIRPFKIGANPDDLSQSVSNDYIGIVKEGNPSGLAKAPLGIAIPYKWKWPKERVNITNAYEGFIAWGKQSDLTLKAGAGGWYKNPTSGTIYEN